ncbi:ABC transporter substrate-binding protein, partial [Aquabacterium sp. A08]|nr:ABC transporter substrate-binding protein [Aquabacterium sp. A08]
MKKLLSLVVLGAASTLTWAQAELKVAIDPTYEPFTYKTADGKPT